MQTKSPSTFVISFCFGVGWSGEPAVDPEQQIPILEKLALDAEEKRGPHEWLRAVQHGHFYVQVEKAGTHFSSTNYPPWTGQWAPEAWWVTSLWKTHKMSHEQFSQLSAKLRDGHAHRKAQIEAVIATETFFEHAKDQSLLLGRLP